jgi:DNA-binding winged helix-turn-helix (wHTH) protein
VVYRFDDFTLDTDARTLRRGKLPIALTPKAFVLLMTLVEKRPQALSHAELTDLLWPNTFVSQTSLPRVVTELRKALDDERGAPRYLRTVHGFGYSFLPEVTAVGRRVSGPRHVGPMLVWGGNTFPLREGTNLIGRSTECDIHVPSARASKRHARIQISGAEIVVEDLGSHNGTLVNGKKLGAPRRIADGDTIAVGPALFVLHAGDTETTTKGDTAV